MVEDTAATDSSCETAAEAPSAAQSQLGTGPGSGKPPAEARVSGDATVVRSVPADWLQLNRENWDDRALVHAQSAFYDLPGFRAGASTLRAFELDELGPVDGKSLLHLQCHMGQDTLSWARLGARVTGLDLSGTAVETARGLAADLGLADRARFVAANVYDAAAALGAADAVPSAGSFDIVYTGLGALVWLPDLTRWAAVVASLLRPGGTFYLVEFHPVTDIVGDDGRTIVRDYFDTAGETVDFPSTYTDGRPLSKTRSVQWPHMLGEIVSAVAQAGLRLEFLHEHPTTLFERYPVLERFSATEYRFPAGHPRFPLMYSLRATKTA